MEFINRLFCRPERKLAEDLVTQLVKELPPKFMQDGTAKLSVNKVTRALERIYYVSKEFRAGKGWGIYRRSVYANAFKWGMKERGYSEKFIDVVIEGLVVELAKPASQK